MTVVQGLLLACRRRLHLPRRGPVQAGVVLMGFAWTIVTLVVVTGDRLALPRLVHGGGVRGPRPLSVAGPSDRSTGCSAPARSRSRPGSATACR